jgi:hypothetical protein
VNRIPKYVKLIKNNNLKIISEIKTRTETVIEEHKLAQRFKNLTLEDRSITGIFFQALKE